MASIVFFADHNEEALRASFELAKQLKRERNTVFYAGVSDSGRCAAESGLDFFPIYESAYANGLASDFGDSERISERRAALLSLFFSSGNELDILIEHVNLKLIFLPPYLALEGLLLTLRYPLLVGFLRHFPPAEPRRTSVRRACSEVLDGFPFGAATMKYLSAKASGRLDPETLIEEICRLPEYIVSMNAPQDEISGRDENVIPLDCTIELTKNLLGGKDLRSKYEIKSGI
jgi:hypothetical protein